MLDVGHAPVMSQWTPREIGDLLGRLDEFRDFAFEGLEGIVRVWESARRYVGQSRPRSRAREGYVVAPEDWYIGPPDAVAFLANYFAFRELEIVGPTVDRALDWVEGVIAEGRTDIVGLSSRPYASAFRAVRMLAAACVTFPSDKYRVSDLQDAFHKEVLSKDPELGVAVRRGGPFESWVCHPSLRGEDLVWALEAGFRGRPVSSDMGVSELHAALSASVASSVAVRRAVRQVQAKPLATFVIGLADSSDLFLLQEELLLEFARVAVRLPELIRQARKSAGQATPRSRKSRHPSPAVDRRGQLAYKLVSNRRLRLKQALAKLQAALEAAGFEPVETINGMTHMAKQYALRQGLPPIPRRRPD